jgi:hypothetical protein
MVSAFGAANAGDGGGDLFEGGDYVFPLLHRKPGA